MDLLDIESGKWVRILAYQGGRRFEHRLRQLGLLPGQCARVLRHAPFGGPLLIEVHQRQLALGRGVAARIEVEEIDAPCDSR